MATENGNSNTFEGLWGSDRFTDVVFFVGEEPNRWRIAAHKLVLCKSSEVFTVMFRGSFKDSAVKEHYVTDVQPEIFDLLLRFLYTSKLDFDTIQEAVLTYKAAHLYRVKDALKICIEFLCSNVNDNNFFDVYNFMEPYMEDPETQALHVKFASIIDTNADQVLKSVAFLSAKSEVVSDISARGTLGLSSELILFDALVRWASTECKRKHLPVTKENKRKVLDKILFNVRFGLISTGEISQGPMKTGLLKEEDINAFNLTPRLNGKLTVGRISGNFVHEELKDPHEHWLPFVFDRNVILTSVTLTASEETIKSNKSCFKLYLDQEVLIEMNLNTNTTKKDDKKQFIHTLELKDPIYIRPQKKYVLYTWMQLGPRIIEADTVNPSTLWFDGTKEYHVAWDAELNFPGCTNNGTSANTGQVFGLKFMLPLRKYVYNK